MKLKLAQLLYVFIYLENDHREEIYFPQLQMGVSVHCSREKTGVWWSMFEVFQIRLKNVYENSSLSVHLLILPPCNCIIPHASTQSIPSIQSFSLSISLDSSSCFLLWGPHPSLLDTTTKELSCFAGYFLMGAEVRSLSIFAVALLLFGF